MASSRQTGNYGSFFRVTPADHLAAFSFDPARSKNQADCTKFFSLAEAALVDDELSLKIYPSKVVNGGSGGCSTGCTQKYMLEPPSLWWTLLHAGLLAAGHGQIGPVAGSAILGCRLVEQDSLGGNLFEQLVTVPTFNVLVGAP
jgi:hypothetical protein